MLATVSIKKSTKGKRKILIFGVIRTFKWSQRCGEERRMAGGQVINNLEGG